MAKMTEGYLQVFVGNSLSIASGKHSLEETLEELQYAINRLSVYDDLSRLDILQAFKCARFIRTEHGRTDLRSDECVRMLGGLLKMNMPLNIFTQNIRDALEKIEVMLFNDFKVIPSYEIINLWDTRPQKGKKSRNYEPLESVKNKQGLYLFFETPNQTQQSQHSSPKASSKVASTLDTDLVLIDTFFYVGKTGTDDGHGDCDVFYKSDGGSGRIPHHIVGGENVLFKKAYNRFIATSQGTERQGTKQGNRKSRGEPGTAITYNDFVNRYSVLCIAIDKDKLGSKFETLLLWWEAYLILELVPVMNESVEVKLGSATTAAVQTGINQTGQTSQTGLVRHSDFKHYWPPSRKFSPLLNSEKAKSEEIRVARTIKQALEAIQMAQASTGDTGKTASAKDGDNASGDAVDNRNTVSGNNSGSVGSTDLPRSVGSVGLPKSITDQYVTKLEKIFNVDPPKMPSLRKAEQILTDYKSLKAVSEADIALFHLHYAECCVSHLDCFGGGPEELYDAAGENFRAALDYAKKDRKFLDGNAELLKDVAYGFPGTEYLADWLEEVLPREDRRQAVRRKGRISS